MRYTFCFIFFLTLFSCGNKKVVQLPEIENASITEVLDVSPIYMFYDEETDSIEFNRKNMIGSTNWLVNIDKRLTLKQVLPHLQYLQEKRHGDGMHKNEKAKNYFTCHDTSINNLGFIEFTDVVYHTGKVESLSEELFEDAIVLDFSSNSINLEKTINDLRNISQSPTGFHPQKNHFVLKFKKTITFQNYISIKSILSELDIENLAISNNEFIY